MEPQDAEPWHTFQGWRGGDRTSPVSSSRVAGMCSLGFSIAIDLSAHARAEPPTKKPSVRFCRSRHGNDGASGEWRTVSFNSVT